MPRPICEVRKLGLIQYQDAWDLQNQFAADVAAGNRPANLLLVEHPHTYTFGRQGNVANLLWDQAELAQRGVTVHWVDRGGDVTYHGPGQLVGYPLIPLKLPTLLEDGNHIPQADYIGYIRKLEKVLIMTLAEFGVVAKTIEGLTGIWIDSIQSSISNEPESDSGHPSSISPQYSISKLAAIGVKVDARGISRHGFALNIDPDMRYWNGIVGCGLEHPEISMAQLLDPLPAKAVIMDAVIWSFQEIFNYEIIQVPIRS